MVVETDYHKFGAEMKSHRKVLEIFSYILALRRKNNNEVLLKIK